MLNLAAPPLTGLTAWLVAWLTPPPSPPPLERPHLADLAQADYPLPAFVRACPVAQKYRDLLGALDWANFPERPANRAWPGSPPHPRAPFVAAYLVKLHEGKTYMSDLREFLLEHPALVWLLGFDLVADPTAAHGFDLAASVPSRKQFGRVLRDLDNAAGQFLLTSTVQLIAEHLPPEVRFGEHISLDTKHIVAWVKENNPKAYVKESDRLNKHRQPKGDRTCKLGCKKRRNDAPGPELSAAAQPAPVSPVNHRPTNFSHLDVYYWGYASGLVATKVPGYGEFVLAELTQTFDQADISYFFPLMTATAQRLGRPPRFGALDAAFDAFYVHVRRLTTA